jgi:hypothetical protein
MIIVPLAPTTGALASHCQFCLSLYPSVNLLASTAACLQKTPVRETSAYNTSLTYNNASIMNALDPIHQIQ